MICSPPSNHELFSAMMSRYREEAGPRRGRRDVRPPSKAAVDEMRDLARDLRDSGLLSLGE